MLLYAPPNVDPVDGQLIIFGWLIFATCLYDTTLTFWAVNYGALFADKFRNHDERRTASGIEMMLVYLGIAVGSLIPPFIIHYGVKESFIDQAWALIIIALIASVFALPGLREDKETINRYLENWKVQKEKGEKGSIIKTFIMTLRNKNFVMYILLFLGYNILRACLLGAMNYGFRFVLKLPAIYSTIVMAAYLLSSLLTTPIWTIIIKKIDNNRKVMLLGAILSCIFTFPITFLTGLVSWMILITLWGVGIAGLYVANRPAFADIIDENVLKTGKRQEGIYNGVSLFIMRFAVVAQAIIFAVVHELTGFVEGADTQSASAIWGIQLTMGAIPMLFLFFGTLAFWKYYDLTPSKVKEIKAKLTELKL